MIIIGITGTLGAGKGTIVEYLVNQAQFTHFSVRDFLTEEVQRRGMEVNRDNMTTVANELRANHSPAYFAEQLYEKAASTGKDCVIESIRTPGEVDVLERKGNFYLFAVDATAKTRYQRIIKRASETDRITFETFRNNEEREMQSQDPNKQNLKACIDRADFVFHNEGNIEELHQQVSDVLKKIKLS